MAAGVADAPQAALMTMGDVAAEVRLGSRTLWRWVSEGRFPAPDLRLGAKVVRWRRETVERWIETGGAK